MNELRVILNRELVPPRLRWHMWCHVAGLPECFEMGKYDALKISAMSKPIGWTMDSSIVVKESSSSLSSSRRSSMTDVSDTICQIKRDLFRTFPGSQFFMNPVHISQLGDVITTFSLAHKQQLGYCQGMNFLAGVLLQVSDSEEESFWLLSLIMDKYNLRGLFVEGLPLLHLLRFEFLFLLHATMKDVHDHLETLQVTPEMFAVKWFFSMFAYSFKLNVVVEIWDFLLAAKPPRELHAGFQRCIIMVSLGITRALRKNLLASHTSEDVVSMLSSIDLTAKQILANTRDVDSKIPQSMMDLIRAKWATDNQALNAAICEGGVGAGTSNP